ncbi:type II secretion system protein [Glaciecola sp. KUL10]|uniref:type II secretion system protein n=1 Tax=Glaciecola sp. (strain KUL10) TaxID=2161813 RepID=UPI000D8CE6BF|nr:type II secretion system protein [Glaciecola sp. KUL10]GBL03638.1 prepilin-type cleavage/methylation [Glaciecola sp. KUL10]
MTLSPLKVSQFYKAQQGFTFVELIIVITLIGILSITAYSRFSGKEDFSAITYQTQTLSLLRNVQTKAMYDSRSNFCYQVNFITNSTPAFGVPIDNFSTGNEATSCASTIGANLKEGLSTSANELTEEGLVLNVVDGTTVIAYLRFDAMGRPLTSVANCSSGCTISFVGTQTAEVCIEPEGYVHAC